MKAWMASMVVAAALCAAAGPVRAQGFTPGEESNSGLPPDFTFNLSPVQIENRHPHTVGIEIRCDVCQGPCSDTFDNAGNLIARGWNRIAVQNISSTKPVAVKAFSINRLEPGDRVPRPHPELGTHYACGLVIWGDPQADEGQNPQASRAVPVVPAQGDNVHAFARADWAGPVNVVLSGLVP